MQNNPACKRLNNFGFTKKCSHQWLVDKNILLCNFATMKCVVSSRFGPICMGDTLWTYFLLISAQRIIATTEKKFGISFFLRSCLWCRSSCIAYIITRSDEILFRNINTLWARFASTVCPQVFMVKQARSIHDDGAASSSHWRSNDGLGLAKTRKPWLARGNCGADADWQYDSSAWNIDRNINTISLSPTFDVHRFGWWFGIEIMQI